MTDARRLTVRRTSKLLVLTASILIPLIAISPFYSLSQLNQSLQPGFAQALMAVNSAEANGATSNETAPLVILLNKALELNREASYLPLNQTQQRDALLSSANQTLTDLTYQAKNLTAAAGQRTSTNKIISYVAASILAVLGTFAYAFVMEFYQRYRIKRTFRMRIRPK